MSNVTETGKVEAAGPLSLLAGRPIWVFWIVHVVVSAALFGVFYVAMYLLALRWWGAVIAIVAAGMIWGSIVYGGLKNKKGQEPETKT